MKNFQFSVVARVTLGTHTEAELLARAAALEAHSTHPLARAICRNTETKGVAPGAEQRMRRR